MPYAAREPEWPQIECGCGELTYDEQIDRDLHEIREAIRGLMKELETLQREHMSLTGVRYYGV